MLAVGVKITLQPPAILQHKPVCTFSPGEETIPKLVVVEERFEALAFFAQ